MSQQLCWVILEVCYEYNDSTYDEDGDAPVQVYRNKQRAQEALEQKLDEDLRSFADDSSENPFDYLSGGYYFKEFIVLEESIFGDYLQEHGIEERPILSGGWGLDVRLHDWWGEHASEWSFEQRLAVLRVINLRRYKLREVPFDELS